VGMGVGCKVGRACGFGAGAVVGATLRRRTASTAPLMSSFKASQHGEQHRSGTRLAVDDLGVLMLLCAGCRASGLRDAR